MQVSAGARTIIVCGAIWFGVFGLASLEQFGASGIADIIDAALNPGDRYRAKFAIFEELQTSGATSLPLQITSWSGVFFALLLPYVIFYWRGLGGVMRTLVMVALLPYVAFYVYIGTIKGIGDLLILAAASFVGCYGLRRTHRDDHGSAAHAGRTTSSPMMSTMVRPAERRRRSRLKYWLVTGGVVFLAIMANLLGGRAVDLDRYPPIPIISELFGDRFSAGLMTIWLYPTNGYTGLSHELTIPFVFSGGASMPVFAPILGKIFGVADPMLLSYPIRNEAINGWSATMTWSTAYASVASDLTFLGTIVAMGLLGWMLAHFWMGVRRRRDPLSLAIFSLLAFVVAYLPANNQIFMTRYTATGLLSLLVIYVLRGLFQPHRSVRGHSSLAPQSKGNW